MCRQISCDITKQQLACHGADLCCATSLSNHWEAAVAVSRKTLREGGRVGAVGCCLSARRARPSRSCYFPLPARPVALASGHELAAHRDAPGRVTVELSRKAAGMNPISAIRPILAPG